MKDFAAQGDLIQCRVSRRLVEAARLIRDVLPSAAYALETPPGRAGFAHRKLCPAPEPEPVKEVFVSYAWADESEAVVDRLREAFERRGIRLVRDRDAMKYRDSIRDFMARVGRGKCVVVVLSKKYLESKSCMFELTQIAGRGDVRDRVFPVVLEDANIYDAVGRVNYIKYWERKKKELDDALKGVGREHLRGVNEELDLFADIRNTIDRLVDILGDMNALSPEQHRRSDFGPLLEALEERLSR